MGRRPPQPRLAADRHPPGRRGRIDRQAGIPRAAGTDPRLPGRVPAGRKSKVGRRRGAPPSRTTSRRRTTASRRRTTTCRRSARRRRNPRARTSPRTGRGHRQALAHSCHRRRDRRHRRSPSGNRFRPSHQLPASKRETNLRTATAQKLIAQAQDMLAGTQPGGDARAFQQILAARTLTNPRRRPALHAVVQRASTLKIITGHTAVERVAFSPDGTGSPPPAPTDDAGVGCGHRPTARRPAAPATPARCTVWRSAPTGTAWSRQRRHHAAVVGCGHRPTDRRPADRPHRRGVGVAFSPDGHAWFPPATTARFGCGMWPPANPSATRWTGHDERWGVAFSPDGHRMASPAAMIRCGCGMRPPANRSVSPGRGTTSVAGVAFSPDGHDVVSASLDKTMRRVGCGHRPTVGAPWTGHTGAVWDVAFSPDGHRLVTGSDDNTVRLWDADTGQPVGDPLTGHDRRGKGVAFSPDGHRGLRQLRQHGAAVGRGHRPTRRRPLDRPHDSVSVWRSAPTDTGRLRQRRQHGAAVGCRHRPTHRRTVAGHTDAVLGVAFSPDGHRLVSASGTTRCGCGTPQTGQPVGDAWTGHNDAVGVWGSAPTGTVWFPLAGTTRCGCGTCRLGSHRRPLDRTQRRSLTVAFSADGRRVLSSDLDTVRLWDSGSGQPIGEPWSLDEDFVSTVAFSPDGRRAVSGSIRGRPAVGSGNGASNRRARQPVRQGVKCGVQPGRAQGRIRQRQHGAAVGC